MIGLVLAAGAGRRLLPLTARLPKALLPVRGEESILDLAVANLVKVGFDTVVVVAGYAGDRVVERVAHLEASYGVDVHVVPNPKAEEWNNAYSLWCARDAFAEGAVLINGDTVHPHSIEERLLGAAVEGIAIAVDDDGSRLTDESMKVLLSGEDSSVALLDKGIPLTSAYGEYIGVSLIHANAAAHLAASLEATWRRNPNLYYEDGFVEFIRTGGVVKAVPIGEVEWVEVDDHDDLARAKELACRY